MTKSHTISIAQPGSSNVLSPEQKKFNALIDAIGVQRQWLTDWNSNLARVQQRYSLEWVPRAAAWADHHADLVRLLDRRADDRFLSKTDTRFLQQLICDMADALMSTRHADEMQAIHQRHRPLHTSPGETALPMDADFETQMAEQEALREAARSAHRQARRKPGAQKAQTRAEAAKEAEEAGASQSLREVYRKLASALHPDREPDADERIRKTGLMQRVNQAYQKNDLLSLLQLQLEIEQIDQNALDDIAEDRLRHYSQVLTGQLDELQQEVRSHEHRFRQQYGLGPHERVTPANVLKLFAQHKQRLVTDTLALQRALQQLGDDDPKAFRRWLRQQRDMAAHPQETQAPDAF